MSQSPASRAPAGVAVTPPKSSGHELVLTTEALAFVADLVRTFRPRLELLLARRRERQARFAAGQPYDFLGDTADIRDSDWTVFPVRGDLLDRRVEMIRPPTRLDVIHGLNSDACCFVADFEDPSLWSWDELVDGQVNLFEAIRRTISVAESDGADGHRLHHRVAVLFVRPRGWGSVETNMTVDDRAVPASLVDFGLFFFHNAKKLLGHCTAPYFYLPSMQSHLEARLWNEVFVHAQRAIGIARASIKAACLIETQPALFEMDEFLWELREHSCGLHRGRQELSADSVERLVSTCHRRGTHAMGGMVSSDPPSAATPAHDTLRTEKLREVRAGLDGTWVTHPSMVPIAKEVFNSHMPGPNQIGARSDGFAETLESDVHAAGSAASPSAERTVHGPVMRGA